MALSQFIAVVEVVGVLIDQALLLLERGAVTAYSLTQPPHSFFTKLFNTLVNARRERASSKRFTLAPRTWFKPG